MVILRILAVPVRLCNDWRHDPRHVPVAMGIVHLISASIIPLDLVPGRVWQRATCDTMCLATICALDLLDCSPLVGVVREHSIPSLELWLRLGHCCSFCCWVLQGAGR